MGHAELDALAGLALAADDLADALELLGHALVGGDDLVEGVGDLAGDADVVAGHADGEVAGPHGLQGMQEFVQFARGFAVGVGGYRRSVLARSCDDRRSSSLLPL